MSQVLEDLVDLLTLEPIEENLFRRAVARIWVFVNCSVARCSVSRCRRPASDGGRSASCAFDALVTSCVRAMPVASGVSG